MMRQILATLVWVLAVFVVVVLVLVCTQNENWLMITINLLIPSTIGYFLGYGQGVRDEKEDI